MTDKKFTQKEVIKALECCGFTEDCSGCPFYTDMGCDENIHTNALDLINRQKAEIERLKETPISQDTIDGFKADVIKEFVERFKKKAKVEIYCDNTLPSSRETYCIEEDGIDNIVKEMTEVEK